MTEARRWDDLRPRLLTGILLVAIGTLEVWVGGWVFTLTAAAVAGAIVWELATMAGERRNVNRVLLGILAAGCLLLARQATVIYQFPLLLLPAVVGAVLLRKHAWIAGLYVFGITIAGFGLILFRDVHGAMWLFWLISLVAATDIAGYFGGRMFGGPKFWPAVSPKKTWSGIIAGWLSAMLVGLIFMTISTAGAELIWLSVLASFASQMGDIAESAVKRRFGAKDSSSLLPGHGGLFDRFDGLLGACLFILLIALVTDIPEIHF